MNCRLPLTVTAPLQGDKTGAGTLPTPAPNLWTLGYRTAEQGVFWCVIEEVAPSHIGELHRLDMSVGKQEVVGLVVPVGSVKLLVQKPSHIKCPKHDSVAPHHPRVSTIPEKRQVGWLFNIAEIAPKPERVVARKVTSVNSVVVRVVNSVSDLGTIVWVVEHWVIGVWSYIVNPNPSPARALEELDVFHVRLQDISDPTGAEYLTDDIGTDICSR